MAAPRKGILMPPTADLDARYGVWSLWPRVGAMGAEQPRRFVLPPRNTARVVIGIWLYVCALCHAVS